MNLVIRGYDINGTNTGRLTINAKLDIDNVTYVRQIEQLISHVDDIFRLGTYPAMFESVSEELQLKCYKLYMYI